MKLNDGIIEKNMRLILY